jgi:hypothetical protein
MKRFGTMALGGRRPNPQHRLENLGLQKIQDIQHREAFKSECSYSQQPSYGNGQDAPPSTNGLRKCGIYTQWNFMQP